jgi:polysaccharide export outer membrane protein
MQFTDFRLLAVALALTCFLDRAEAQAQPAARASVPAAEVPADFIIGAGDVLGVLFWREADVSGDVTVRPDGRVTLPMIGAMQAAGLRPEGLQTQIQAAAAKFFTEPTVTVVVRTINSRKIFVTGRVVSPGAHALVAPLTVLQAIALSGGVTEYADKKNVTILRVENGQSRTIKFNYKDVVKGKGLHQNIQLQPGDTVVVP